MNAQTVAGFSDDVDPGEIVEPAAFDEPSYVAQGPVFVPDEPAPEIATEDKVIGTEEESFEIQPDSEPYREPYNEPYYEPYCETLLRARLLNHPARLLQGRAQLCVWEPVLFG